MPSHSFTTITGNLAADPEYMEVGDKETPLAKFDVAVNERWQTSDGKFKEEVTWFPVEAWRWLAKTARDYLVKGVQVQIVGKMKKDIWTNKEGQKRSSWYLKADKVLPLAKAEPKAAVVAEPQLAGMGGEIFNDETPASDMPF